jgi:hypothetical protein
MEGLEGFAADCTDGWQPRGALYNFMPRTGAGKFQERFRSLCHHLLPKAIFAVDLMVYVMLLGYGCILFFTYARH